MKKLLLAFVALFLMGGLMAQNAPMQKVSKSDAAKIAVTHPQILKGDEYTAVPRNFTSMLGNGNFIGGTFYELPAENAGGFAKARAIATHRSQVYDYCTWRGLFVISGVDPAAVEAGEHFVKSDDGKAALWVGVADDLWKIGKPVGVGGPWLATAVKAGVPSDPYIVTGFDKKQVAIIADKNAKIRLEFDVTGSGTWIPLYNVEVKAGKWRSIDLGGIRAYWVRAVADCDCTATVQFKYE